jgi:hypothetical protein
LSRIKGEVSPEMFDRYLTEAQLGRAGIESRSDKFPGSAAPLRTLLEVADRVRAELAPADPEGAFVDASLARLLNHIRIAGRGRRQVSPRPVRPARPIWRLAFAPAMILLVAALLLGGAGVVQASAEALPGGSLYVVKRAVEETRLALTGSAAGDAALMEKFAEERLSEASTLSTEGSSDDLALALAGYDEMIARLTALASTSELHEGPGSLAQLRADLDRHIQILQGVGSHAAAAAQVHINEAVERSRHNRSVIEQLESGESPSDLAPGQEKTPKSPAGKPDEDRGKSAEDTPEPAATEKPHGPPPWARPHPTKTKAP